MLVTRATYVLRLGRADEAEALTRRALQSAARRPEALCALAKFALELEEMTGRSAVADEVASATLVLDEMPAQRSREPAAAWHSLVGWACARHGKLDEAAQAFGAAVELAPDDLDSWRALARARYGLEDIDGALKAWQRVIAVSPGDWEAHNDTGSAFMEQNDWARAEGAFTTAAKLAPDQPIIVVNRATLDVRRGQRRDAIVALKACVARHPGCAPAFTGLGFALRDEGRLEEASDAFRRATTLAPDDATAACALGRVLLESGDAQAASSEAQAFLRRRPGHAGALALEVGARRALGEEAAVSYLLDPRFVSQSQLVAPQGFVDLAAFNAALAEHAAAHRTLQSSPASHATAGGLHSGSMLVSPRGPVAAFEKALRVAIASYSRALPELRRHPFVENRPQAAFFNIWCVVLQRGGHQFPHIHPEAWLSGVYYPQVPAGIRAPVDPDDPAGCLELGAEDGSGPTCVPPRLTRIRPAEGLLVLFPSYFYHRTVPFDAEGTRISVAFDLMPARGVPRRGS